MGGTLNKKISEKKSDEKVNRSNTDLSETFTSRMVVTSSIYGPVMDGAAGKGGPFVNSMIRVLLKNTSPKLSISELVRQTGKELIDTYPNFDMTPGIGVLRNSSHQGGEFKFKLKDEFIELNKDDGKSEADLLEKSIRESMKKLEKEFITKLESNHKMYEEKIKDIEKKEIVEKSEKSKTVKIDKKELLSFLKEDKVEKYFDEIDAIQDYLEEDVVTDLFVLQGSWTSAENQARIGVISKKDEYLEKNQIRKGLIEITSTLKAVEKKDDAHEDR